MGCKKTCGLCSGDAPDGFGGEGPGGAGGACVGDRAAFDSGYGDCGSYAQGGENHAYCAEDQDLNTGMVAAEVCPGCGRCTASLLTVEHSTRRKIGDRKRVRRHGNGTRIRSKQQVESCEDAADEW